MQAPKKRTSKSRRNMRRAHDGLKPSYLSTCPNCKSLVASHCICMSCGYYRGRQLITVANAESSSAE